MLKLDERGEINHLMLPFIVVMVLCIGFGVAFVWAYSSYSNEKNNVDVIVAEAVASANAEQEAELRAQFAEEQKSPYRTYTSPSALGSVKIVYPKSWSAYVDAKETGGIKLDGFFHPSYVPSESSDKLIAISTEIVNSDYTKTLATYQKNIDEGLITAKAVRVSGATGTRFDGQIDKDFSGAVVILPLRDRTLRIWTESTDFLADFNQVISDLTYSP